MTEYDNTILKTQWVAPTRPYSQKELNSGRDYFLKKLGLSSDFVKHEKCGHFYHVKVGGNKHKELLDSDTQDIGNCSVCWKLHQTPRNLKNAAREFVDLYKEKFNGMDFDRLSYYSTSIERIFYIWLYRERYNRK